MSDTQEAAPPHFHGVTFGKVVAGAAVALGAVLLAVTLSPSLLNPAVAAPAAPTPGPSTWTQIGDALKSFFIDNKTGAFTTASKLLAGGTLVGGGLMLNSTMNERQDLLEQHAKSLGDPLPGGQAEKLELAALNSVIRGRMMAESPELMQQMMGGASAARG